MKIPLRLTVFTLLCLFSSAHGQVVLQDSYSAGSPGGAPTDLGGGVIGYEYDMTGLFSAAGHDKLVLVYSGSDGNQAGTATVTNVTYDGVAMTEAVYGVDNLQIITVGIYYLDNVATDGILRIEIASGTNQTVHGFGLYALDGTKTGVQDTGTGRTAAELTTTAPVTISTNSGFFVQEAARNNQSLAGDEEDDYETLYDYSAQSTPEGANVGTYEGLSQYQLTTSPGDYLAPINNTGDNYRRVVTAAFEAVEGPAPAADPRITSFNSVGTNLWELTLAGKAETGYEFYSSTTLEFTPGTLLENLTQGDPGDAGTIGGTNDSVLTTDANGDGKVRVILTGSPADFLRARPVP
jgi:hypothetical protein